jgi:hypothetical protein
VVSGLSEIAFGAGFFITWYDPAILGDSWVKFGMEVMLLEFILIHSAPFMALRASSDESTGKKVGGFLILGGFYSLFVAGFSLSLGYWRPMLTFWIVTFQRMLGEIADPKPSVEAKAWTMTGIALNALCYLLLVPVTLFLPLPRLGITSSLQQTLGISGEGAWQDEPHRVVVMAGAYYILRGILTATAWPRQTSAKAAEIREAPPDKG